MVISNLKIGTSYFFTLLKEFAKENIRYHLLARHQYYTQTKINHIQSTLSLSKRKTSTNVTSIASAEQLRNYILGIPVELNGKKTKKDYPFRKMKDDIIEQLDNWVKKDK